MQNAITTLRIQNFKSIKDVTLTPRRVNIIIGEPNVGKSNILEALSLLGGMVYEQRERFMGDFIRYEEPYQLFYQNDIAQTIKITTDKDIVLVGKSLFDYNIRCLLLETGVYKEITEMSEYPMGQLSPFGDSDAIFLNFFDEQIVRGDHEYKHHLDFIYGELKNENHWKDYNDFVFGRPSISALSVRLYLFQKYTEYKRGIAGKFLEPPFGENILDIIRGSSKLSREISVLLEQTKHKMLVRMAVRNLEVAQEVNDITYTYPYSSIADTLQRLIFYLAAIESNTDAVLLFEEPEAHSYPTYVAQLGQSIVESRNNQFFIVTHSPYLVTEILEEMLPKDELATELAIFVAYYEEYQTKVRQLTEEEVIAVRSDGLDVFYNLGRFVPGQME